MVDLLIRNCRFLLNRELIQGNIVISKGKIEGFTKSGKPGANQVYNAKNRIALPGGVDPHVHFRDPSSNPAEDFESGTMAAAHGGVTTVADMPNTEPPVTSAKVLKEKIKNVQGKAYVDFMLIGGVGRTTVENVREMVETGVGAVKTFMISRFPELSAQDTETLKRVMMAVKKHGVPLMVHAEDEGAIVKVEGEKPSSYSKERMICESVGVARVLELAKQLKCHVHIVHMSSADSLNLISTYKGMGVKVTVETIPHYLMLTMEEMDKLGPYAKVDPPLKRKIDNERLIEGVSKGEIDFVVSDHAPYPRREKEKGFKDIHLAPSGMPGVETTLPALFTLYLNRYLSLERLIKVFSTNPAKFLGIFPRKGALLPGSDADIVLVDPKSEFKVTEDQLLTKTRQSIFMGKTLKGEVVATFSRGELVMENREIFSTPGRGAFLKRTH